MAAEPKVLVPSNGAPPVGPYSPGLETSEYVYVSGQGVRNAKSEMPAGIQAQTQQCVDNVRVILEATGLKLSNVVSVQLYLSDLKTLPEVEKIYRKAFVSKPSRVILGVARMPTDTTVEITVVAKKNPKVAGDRIYLPGLYGKTAAEVDRLLDTEFKRAGMDIKHALYANRYVVGGTDAGVIPVNALPNGATHAIFAIGAKKEPKDLTLCTVASGDANATLEDQTKLAFGKLSACLASNGMTLANAVATNVYIDDIGDFAKMNAIYANFFPGMKPTRTTVQPLAPAKSGTLIRISAVAAR